MAFLAPIAAAVTGVTALKSILGGGSKKSQPASKPDIPYKQTTAPGFTGEPPATPTPPVESDQPKGPAEAAAADTAKKGRRSTIGTTSQGLLAPAKTRKQRSLMGGLIT